MIPRCVVLPIRPQPIHGELASGYLVRVASANGYSGPRELCRVVGMRHAGPKAALNLRKTERAMLFGPFPHYCRTNPAQLHGLRLDDFNHHFMRWCPACLAEFGYLRGEWGLKLCCACVTHAALLQDRCPHCRALQRLQRAELSVCDCGICLARSPCVPAPAALLDLHRTLLDALASPDEGRATMRPTTWLRLVKYLGPFDADPLTRRPGQARGLHQLPVSLALASGAANLLADWPANFERLLTRIRAAAPSATHIAEAFGSLYHVLYHDLNEPALAFLREGFEAYLHDNWFGLLGRRNRRLRPETVARHPHRPAQAIAQAANTGKTAIRHLASAGVIRGRVIQHLSGRTTWAIPDGEASLAAACKADSLTLRQTAELLGIGRKRVRELIDAGLLRVWINPGRTGAAAWWLSRTDVDRLVGLASPTGQVDKMLDCIELTTVLRTWRLQDGELPALVRALLSNELGIAGRAEANRGLGGLLFAVPLLRTWFDAHRAKKQSWMSVDCAASLLGLKQQVAYELVKRGLLVADLRDGIRRVHRDAVEVFRAAYVSLSDIARIHGKTPRQMLTQLVAKPVCGPTADGARQYFYKREDVEAALAAVTQQGEKP